MVEPAAFCCNPATALDNHFQHEIHLFSPGEVQGEAVKEFTRFRERLQASGIEVVLFKDDAANQTPDSVYPNNWFTTHADSVLVLYPMRVESRRRERREDMISFLQSRYVKTVDLRSYEQDGRFLEGTGSLVLDRVNRIAYACRSQRTDDSLLREWGKLLNYRVISFSAFDHTGDFIYHTNVMMNIGAKFAVLCTESFGDAQERERVTKALHESKHEIVDISLGQLRSFCGNVLELKDSQGNSRIVMSQRAYNHFSDAQRSRLQSYGELIYCDISTIETYGGGGARCMLAELF